MARRFLVTGGAGYVGSHLVAALVERGETVVVLDNLRTGHRRAVPPDVQLVVADLADADTVDALLYGSVEGRPLTRDERVGALMIQIGRAHV